MNFVGIPQPPSPFPQSRGNANLRLKKEVALKYEPVFLTEMSGLDQTIFRGASKLPVLDY
jgi:hypothetical protein